MTYFATRNGLHGEHPIDLDTELAHRSSWEVQAVEDNAVVLSTEGLWRTYRFTIQWIDDHAALQITGGFAIKPPESGEGAMLETLRLHNDQIVFGRFTFDGEFVRFRYALATSPADGPQPMALGRLVDLAVEACDVLYPALRMASSGRYLPDEALDAAAMEPVGSA